MRTFRLIVLLVLLSSCLAKYEDQFGKVYDWKKEGFAQPVDVVFGKDSMFLVTETGISVVDFSGTIGSSRQNTIDC